MGFELTNSFLEEFDFMFHPFLKQQGSKLMQAVTQMPVTGDVKYIRQQDVGDAHWITDSGSTTKYTATKFDRRRLKPRAFACPIMLDEFDMIKQGTPDPSLLAAQAANSCGKLIDQIIIQGLGGTSYTESEGKKELSGAKNITTDPGSATKLIAAYDQTQTISWNDCTFGGNDSQNSMYVKAGLSASKLNKAVQKLLSKHNYGPIFCVGSNYAMATARADYRVASSDFNDVHSFMQGVNLPYCGVSAFIPCEEVDSGKTCAKIADGAYDANTADVEYAYVFAMNQIVLGSSMPISLKNGTNAERYLNDVLMYRGAYDCTRLFEESVVRIEILKNPDKNDAFVG